MNENETDYLNKLFDSSLDLYESNDVEIPLVHPPKHLTRKLYAIVDDGDTRTFTSSRWPKFTSIAASLFMAVIVVQFYQQQQTMKQLELAQEDLATALHYLSQANRITREQVLESLNAEDRYRVRPAMDKDQEQDIDSEQRSL